MGQQKSICAMCDELAAIINGTGQCVNGVCVVSQFRGDIDATILGRETRSPLVLPVLLSFENLDRSGRALSLGETVILQEEINPFISVLRANGILVTALHNHWLFEEPRLFYLHWEAIMKPVEFMEAVAAAFETIGVDFGNDATDDDDSSGSGSD